eukprot:1991003-Prymnesium_polylepis.2
MPPSEFSLLQLFEPLAGDAVRGGTKSDASSVALSTSLDARDPCDALRLLSPRRSLFLRTGPS